MCATMAFFFHEGIDRNRSDRPVSEVEPPMKGTAHRTVVLNAQGINRLYGVGRHPQTSLWVAPRRYVTALTNQNT